MPPKTSNSKKPVPVMRQLAQRLEMHRLRCGEPKSGPMFATSLGTRISINNMLNRQMRPAMDRCRHCDLPKGKAHAKADHRFERDPRLPEWHGWHAARRGLSTNLFRLGVPDKTIQSILRHSNVQVTQAHYIKPADADAVAAMGKLEIAAHELLDSDRTVNRTVGAQAKVVN